MEKTSSRVIAGSYARIAATPDKLDSLGITWSLNLTNEAGFIVALAAGLAKAVMFRGLCAIIEAYLIYWAVVDFVARRFFKFSREWAAPLASGISICGVSAAIATGAAIRARPIVPIMVSSLAVEIWHRFPKFVFGYLATFLVILLVGPVAPAWIGKARGAMAPLEPAHVAVFQ